MTLPTGSISFAQINAELGRYFTNQYSLDDAEGRKLAAAGFTGQNINSGTPAPISNYHGNSRTNVSVGGSLDSNGYYSTYNLESISLAGGNYVAGRTYNSITINSGTVLGSTSTGAYALTLNGNNGDILEMYNNGVITGAGGSGGAQNGGSGSAGGNALLVNYPTRITNNGSIWGGGGGGGAGNGGTDGSPKPAYAPGGSGGGGGGYVPGPGGSGDRNSGNPGSLSAGGSGWGPPPSGGGYGGTGGGPGQSGAPSNNGGGGGAAGYYVVGGGNVTWTATNDIRGNAA
jgi:hypothetical protein